jgi:hypothetical protein
MCPDALAASAEMAMALENMLKFEVLKDCKSWMLFEDSLRPAERWKDCVDGVIESDALVLSTVGAYERRESSSWNDTQHKKNVISASGKI